MECVNPYELLEIEDTPPPLPSGDPWELIVGEPALIAHILCLTHRELRDHERGFKYYQTDDSWGPPRLSEKDKRTVCRNTCSLLSASRHTYELYGQDAFWQPLLEYCFPNAPRPPARRRRTWPPPLKEDELFIQMCRRNLDRIKILIKVDVFKKLWLRYENDKFILEKEERVNPGLPEEKPQFERAVISHGNLVTYMENAHIRGLITAAQMERRMREWNPPRPKWAMRHVPWFYGCYMCEAVHDVPADVVAEHFKV